MGKQRRDTEKYSSSIDEGATQDPGLREALASAAELYRLCVERYEGVPSSGLREAQELRTHLLRQTAIETYVQLLHAFRQAVIVVVGQVSNESAVRRLDRIRVMIEEEILWVEREVGAQYSHAEIAETEAELSRLEVAPDLSPEQVSGWFEILQTTASETAPLQLTSTESDETIH